MAIFFIQFEDPATNWGIGWLKKDDNWQNYVTASYYIITTVTTVGYGDIHATTTSERIFSIFIMVLGISFFGLFSAGLIAIMTQHDYESRIYFEKVSFLHLLRIKYSISDNLYREIRNTL